jgi:hypothetical protein
MTCGASLKPGNSDAFFSMQILLEKGLFLRLKNRKNRNSKAQKISKSNSPLLRSIRRVSTSFSAFPAVMPGYPVCIAKLTHYETMFYYFNVAACITGVSNKKEEVFEDSLLQ